MFAKSLWLSPLSPRVLTFNLRILPVKEHLFPSTFQMEDLISSITASSWYDRVQPNFSFLHLKLHLLVALSPILLETAQSFEGEEERSCNYHLLLLAEIVFVFDIFFFTWQACKSKSREEWTTCVVVILPFYERKSISDGSVTGKTVLWWLKSKPFPWKLSTLENKNIFICLFYILLLPFQFMSPSTHPSIHFSTTLMK